MIMKNYPVIFIHIWWDIDFYVRQSIIPMVICLFLETQHVDTTFRREKDVEDLSQQLLSWLVHVEVGISYLLYFTQSGVDKIKILILCVFCLFP